MTSRTGHDLDEESGLLVRICGRLLLVSVDGRVLLVRATDPDLPELCWWEVPGGGVEGPTETPREAAIREVAEETGYRISSHQVGEHLWDREAYYWHSGQLYHSRESVFLARLKVALHPQAPTMDDEERATILECRWWSREQLATGAESFVPARLPELVGQVLAETFRGPITIEP